MKSKIFIITALFLLFYLTFFQSVFADGMIHIYDPDMYRWDLLNENQQLSVINYENGFQKMILSVDVTELRGEKAVWLFPVPAKPDKTVIDVIKGFPKFWGYDVKEKTDDTISGTFSVIRLSQVYTFPFLFLFSSISSLSSSGARNLEEGITIHEHIEKMGLTTELVSVKESDALYNYLTNKGLDLPSGSKSILDEYIGKDYSFVVSWISDVAKFKQESSNQDIYGRTINTVGVSITFPTNKIYFPLKPTSVYGSSEIPILIYVIGHVTPNLYQEIKQESQINYFVQDYYTVSPEFSSFFNGKTRINELEYTKIKINAPSKYLREDLWIKNSAPINITLADFINRNTLICGLIFFVLTSCLASLFSGLVVFRKDKIISNQKLALFGLWNFLTLIGFAIASVFLRTKKLKPELEQQLKSEGIIVWDGRKILFVFLFTIFFLIITFVFQIVLQYIF
ncbi:MAG: DUF2330 domain-containing protein [Candidatus Aenigmarchaeota archaeon]|nr:DUF2330 domain-containing protein [Candidatus Aenigmarchaeota archaeon]